jgi:hypothetical protein
MTKKKKKTPEDIKMDELMHPITKDVPSPNPYSIESYERLTGHGFWGNARTGYFTDDEVKNQR